VRRALAPRARRVEGLSPHAPFTVGRELFAALGRIARRRRLPVSIHWAETRGEVAWLRDGSGPLAELLGASPRASGLELIRRAGLLRAPLSLIHGNHPEPGDALALARAGAVVVHCPGTHAWFAREPFPLRHFARHGVRVALGTDSLASNDDLDLGAEMRRLRESAPELAPAAVWDMVTRNAALALGARGELGELRRGAHADCVARRTRARSRKALLEELTLGASAVGDTWIGGRALRLHR
jgi:cytosine/adenosine deaminase-related metal-dependent hydrolase